MRKISGLIFLSAAVLCCVSCRDKSTVAVKQPVSVGVLSVGEAVNVGLDHYVGEVRASRTVVLSPRHNGKLTSFNISQGDEVAKEQIVAEVESSTVIGAYEMSQATLKQAEDAYARLQKVHGTGSVSDVTMVDIETQLSKARASAASAEQALADCSVLSRRMTDAVTTDAAGDAEFDSAYLTRLNDRMDTIGKALFAQLGDAFVRYHERIVRYRSYAVKNLSRENAERYDLAYGYAAGKYRDVMNNICKNIQHIKIRSVSE